MSGKRCGMRDPTTLLPLLRQLLLPSPRTGTKCRERRARSLQGHNPTFLADQNILPIPYVCFAISIIRLTVQRAAPAPPKAAGPSRIQVRHFMRNPHDRS